MLWHAKSGIVLAAALLAALLVPSPALAHKVNVFAYAEDGMVHAECFFADGGRCAGSKLTVQDETGAQLLEGVTDGEGRFSFKIPEARELTITLHAGMGHSGSYKIKASGLAAAGGGGDGKKASALKDEKKDGKETGKTSGQAAHGADPGTGKPASPGPVHGVDAYELRRVVDEAVEARMKPMYAVLYEMRAEMKKPSVGEIIGGIGYIFGLLGIAMYFKSRKV